MSLALQVWIALAVILAAGELLDPHLLLLPFAIGAAAAALIELFHGPNSWQWIAFVGIASVLVVVFQRRLAARKRREEHDAEDPTVS